MRGIIYYLAIDKGFGRSRQKGKKRSRVPKWNQKLPNWAFSRPTTTRGPHFSRALCARSGRQCSRQR